MIHIGSFATDSRLRLPAGSADQRKHKLMNLWPGLMAGQGMAPAVFWPTGCPFPCDRLAKCGAKFSRQPHTDRPGMNASGLKTVSPMAAGHAYGCGYSTLQWRYAQ